MTYEEKYKQLKGPENVKLSGRGVPIHCLANEFKLDGHHCIADCKRCWRDERQGEALQNDLPQ